MKMKDKNGRYCKECGRQKFFFKQFCIFCFKKTKSNIHISISETISVYESFKIRTKVQGFKKFILEILSGWFRSRDKKLKHGVEKVRTIDKKNDEYHEVVKDYKTKEVIHECHELLSVHHYKKI